MINIKILIIGIVASGKTTLAKKLACDNNICHYEIDSIVHDDFNKSKRTISEQLKLINKINENDSWIIEGTLRKNLDVLLEYADKIIFIDIPLGIRKRRILVRYLKQKLGIEKCNYKPTIEMVRMMYKWTGDFEKGKVDFEKRLDKYKNKVIRLNTVKDVYDYKI